MHILQKATIIFSFSLFICPPTFAEDPEQTTKEAWQISHQIEKQIQSTQKDLKAQLETYSDAKISKLVNENFKSAEKRLEKQGERLEKQGQQQLESVKDLFAKNKDVLKNLYYETKEFISKIITGAYIFIISLTGLVAFIFFRHEKTLKDTIEEHFEKSKKILQKEIEELEQEVVHSKENIENQLNEYDRMKVAYDNIILENKALKNELRTVTAYMDKKIIWAYEEKDSLAVSQSAKEIRKLRSKKFSVRECEPGQEYSIAPEECDLMVYFYRNTDQATKRIISIRGFMESIGKEIPLIIYTYKCYLNKEQMDGLGDFENYVISNIPLTLHSYISSLIY